MEKDLVIGAFNNFEFEVLKPWIYSLNESGFDGDKILIAIDVNKETINKIESAGIQVLSAPNMNAMIHMMRFIYIYNYLKTTYKQYRYVITTDVRDVIFQTNPSKKLEQLLGKDKKIIAPSEAIQIKNEEWNRQNIEKNFGPYFYNELKDNTVYNVGTFAGDAEYIKDLCLFLYQLSINRPDWVADQAAFNLLLSFQPFKDITFYSKLSDAWACNAHVSNKPDQMAQFGPFLLEERPKFENNMVVNKYNEPFAILHQYDRVPEWFKFYSKKYNQVLTKYTNTGTAPKYVNYGDNV